MASCEPHSLWGVRSRHSFWASRFCDEQSAIVIGVSGLRISPSATSPRKAWVDRFVGRLRGDVVGLRDGIEELFGRLLFDPLVRAGHRARVLPTGRLSAGKAADA